MNTATDLSPSQFGAVSTLVHRVCGINLHSGKFELVRARLSTRMRELGVPDFDSYFAMLDADSTGTELAHLVDVLTTNKTSFFREPKHFEFLAARVVPELYRSGAPLRVWSAGCSSGEEAWTLAMVLSSVLPADGFRILATDISARMITTARRGVYPLESLLEVPPELRRQYFRQEPGSPRSFAATDRLRRSVRFAQLNLMDHWPMKAPLDLICCRNVMIYFDRDTQQALVERFCAMLAPGGYFFGGHSESFAGLEHAFEYVQPAVYRRPA